MGVYNNIDSRLAREVARTDVVDAPPTSAAPDPSCLPAVTDGASVFATELAGAQTRLWNGPDLILRGLAKGPACKMRANRNPTPGRWVAPSW